MGNWYSLTVLKAAAVKSKRHANLIRIAVPCGIMLATSGHARVGEKMNVDHLVRHALCERVDHVVLGGAGHDRELARLVNVGAARIVAGRLADDKFDVLSVREIPSTKRLTLVKHCVC